MSFGGYLALIHKRHASKHWYLLRPAVNPNYQGKGYASTLLKAMFARIDKEHLPCYLETQIQPKMLQSLNAVITYYMSTNESFKIASPLQSE